VELSGCSTIWCAETVRTVLSQQRKLGKIFVHTFQTALATLKAMWESQSKLCPDESD